MNHQDIEQLFSRARAVRLSEEAKSAGRSALSARMSLAARPSRPAVRSAWLGQSWLRAGAFASLLLLISGTAWAAEGALPGDALYAWKTRVNEPARLAFLPTQIARAEWSVELMTRRLNEAEKLAAEGRLSDETHVFLEDRLNEEWQRADSYGQPENDEWCEELEAEIEKRLEGARYVEVRKDAGRLRIWVREEHEEEESEEEKRLENEVRHEGGWIEETELHEDRYEIENDNDDDNDDAEQEPRALKSGAERADSAEKSSESKTESVSTKTTPVTSESAKTQTAADDNDEDEEADEEDSAADDDELISESTARSKALAAVPGTVKESELKDEEDDPVWEVKIRRSSDDEEVKVIVDARSGSIEEIED